MDLKKIREVKTFQSRLLPTNIPNTYTLIELPIAFPIPISQEKSPKRDLI